MDDLKQTILAAFDDAAAGGDPSEFVDLNALLNAAVRASRQRRLALVARLKGDIAKALCCEEMADELMAGVPQ